MYYVAYHIVFVQYGIRNSLVLVDFPKRFHRVPEVFPQSSRNVLNTGRAHSIREGRPCRMRVIEKQPFRRQESTEFHVYSLRDKHGQVDPTRKTVRSETPLDVPNHVHWLFHCQKKTTTKTLYTIAYVWGRALEMFEETYPPPSLV
jgi:hypothetical protein